MLDKNRASDIFSQLKKQTSAPQLEVTFYGGSFALTRFANNVIHQNVAEENSVVSIRPIFEGRTARTSTNRLDQDSLLRALRSAETLAKAQKPDPHLLPLYAPSGSAPALNRYSEETAAVSPAHRADTVAGMIRHAQRHKLTAAGIVSTSESVEGIFNSSGLSCWHRQTQAEISITMLGSDSSGWQKGNAVAYETLDGIRMAEVAAGKAAQSRSPREEPPGKYTVILEPSAVLDIVGFMFWDFGALSLLDQRSFLNDRIGTQLFGKNIDVWDDAYHPLQSGSPFDGEGVSRQKVHLIEKGVVRNLVFARGTAEKFKSSSLAGSIGPVAPTGHGFALPNEMGEMPGNIVFSPSGSSQSIDEMIASTERGLYVTRLWYIREVDPYEKILTGMTRDGTFLIEDGKLKHGVRNFRFNESLLHMLSNVEAMSEPVRASGEESMDMVVPAMKVRDFNFTEVTKF